MSSLNVLYRDVDRAPYLFTLRAVAKRHDLDLNFERSSPANPGWADRLERGDVDFLAENYWGLQTFRARGSPFITVASVVNHMTEKLLANASVTSVDDLRGKKLAVRGAGPQVFLPGLWLKDLGLARDVEQVVISEQEAGRWGHWKKVANGECAACFMTTLYSAEPLAAGLHEVPYDRYYFEGMNVTLTTTEQLIRERRADVQSLVNATFDATETFRGDAPMLLKIMREECLDQLKEHFDIPDDRRLESLYEILRDELAEYPVPAPEGILNALRVVRGESAGRPQRETHTYEDDVLPPSFNPLLMWDLSFAREALRTRGR